MFKSIKLKDISRTIGSGVTPLRSNADFWVKGTISWLKTEQLGEHKIYDTTEKITEFAVRNTSIKVFPKNTLSIAMYGEGRTRGNVSILKNEMTTNQACCNIVIDDTKADYEYVYYFLKTQYQKLRSLSSGVRKNLNSNDIKEFEVKIPKSLLIQRQIASVLSALDSKIELNNKINMELEAMAKTLYDYWFVQFDFPNTEGKPYKSSGGEMVYNEELKREIPKGWEVKDLLKIASFTNGLACQKFRPTNENYLPVIKIREMNDGISINTEKVSTDIPEKYIVQNGDVLFSWSATLDVKIWTGGIGALNQHIFKVNSKVYPRSFYYFQLLNYLEHFKMMASLRKTTMGHITQDHLKESRIALPPLNFIEKLDSILKPVIGKIIQNKIQNQELAKLRDWLLPMLINGQVTVGNNDYVVEDYLGMAAAGEVEYKLNKIGKHG
ncbi:restriction endonuclease subunit S [Pedobacter changchengzhani]|uniref:Restriction endonuclease subunit S n=1 Tax=Pedobacter changchengzhani TaxID=2529274 RepID=A0A4R5MKK1_9SPHI|nr:restriction endonuclease subunit S [Pedobacter changchengzhani]TDG36092.1 restriction endonuclease subunit S [Pedobacter changchengzhani]